MTKLMVIPNHCNIEEYDVDAYLLGYQDLSVNFPFTVTLDQIKEMMPYIQREKKELFLGLNKNMDNEDLGSLKQLLLEIDSLGLAGIFYYDVALVQMKEECNFKTPLVWAAEHLTTNYATVNYWSQFGVNFSYLSAELTKEEILEIKNNTENRLIVPVFGYQPMFVSKRHEIKNYLNYFNIENDSKHYTIQKEGKTYPIVDNKEGTVVFSSHILNGYNEFLEFQTKKIDYVLLNGYFIEDKKFKTVIQIFKIGNQDGEEQIHQLFSNTDKGFFYKETVYQVKKI